MVLKAAAAVYRHRSAAILALPQRSTRSFTLRIIPAKKAVVKSFMKKFLKNFSFFIKKLQYSMKRTAFFKFFYGLSAPTYFAEQIGKNARNVLFCRYALYAVSRFFVPRKRDCGIKILTLLRIIIYIDFINREL